MHDHFLRSLRQSRNDLSALRDAIRRQDRQAALNDASALKNDDREAHAALQELNHALAAQAAS